MNPQDITLIVLILACALLVANKKRLLRWATCNVKPNKHENTDYSGHLDLETYSLGIDRKGKMVVLNDSGIHPEWLEDELMD